jgi:hypothetical protein
MPPERATGLQRHLRGFVGPYHRTDDGVRHSPLNHYRSCRRTFRQTRRRALLSTWLAYYVNWTERGSRP